MPATSRADGRGVIRGRRTSRGKSTTWAPRRSPRNVQPRPRAKTRCTSSARKAQRRATTRARRRASRLCARSAWRLAALPVVAIPRASLRSCALESADSPAPRLARPRKDEERRHREFILYRVGRARRPVREPGKFKTAQILHQRAFFIFATAHLLFLLSARASRTSSPAPRRTSAPVASALSAHAGHTTA